MTKNGRGTQAVRWAVAAIALAALLATALYWPGLDQAKPAVAADPGSCDPARPHDVGDFNRTIESGGLTREYILHVPTSYTGEEAVPLLFNFHGYTSAAFEQDYISELPAKAEAAGFILVTPQGTQNADGLNYWNSWGATDSGPDDVGFVDDLLTELQGQLCVDPLRVYSTGLSNGAMMSSLLACTLADRIAAVAPVAGTRFFEGSCSSLPVPIIAFHGTEDLLVDLDSAEESAIPAWAAHNGCATMTEQNPVPGTVGVRLVRNEDCDQDANVELYVVFDADPDTPGDQGGGHHWPGSSAVLPPPWDAILGITTHEISANDLMWEFFMAHPMPEGQLRPVPTPTSEPPSISPPAELSSVAPPDTGAGGGGGSTDSAALLVVAIALGAVALPGAAWLVARRRSRS